MKNKILVQVLVAIALAIVAGLITGPTMGIFGFTFLEVYQLIGQLFLNALTLVVVPLVASSVITGAARMSAEGSFGQLGLKTLGYFVLTNFIAIAIGIIFVSLIQPGSSHETTAPLISAAEQARMVTIEKAGEVSGFTRISEILYKIVPSNIFAVISQGQMLGLITFSLTFGFFISKIDAQPASVLLSFWKGIFQVMMQITHLVMKALPIGVFGLVAKVVATTGAESLRSVAWFTLTMLSALAFYALVALPILLRTIGRVSPLTHLRAMTPALLTAFSTSSSAVALPVTIECVEKRANVSNRICSFSIPLGTSLNLSASALGVGVSVLFIAQSYGMELSIPDLIFIGLMILVSSFGIAGIPSACLVTVVLVLNMLGLPPDAIGLFLAVERILDMCRTTVNVFGNSCCAVLVARSEGEKGVLQAVSTS